MRKIGIDPKLIERYDTNDKEGYTPKGKKESTPRVRRLRSRNYKKIGKIGTRKEV